MEGGKESGIKETKIQRVRYDVCSDLYDKDTSTKKLMLGGERIKEKIAETNLRTKYGE